MDWAQLVIQLPIVAAFIWYSLELQKRYQESMDRRDRAYLDALDRIASKLEVHDRRIEEELVKRNRKREKP